MTSTGGGGTLTKVWGKIKLRKPIIGVWFYIKGVGDHQFGASDKLHYDNQGNTYLHVCFMPSTYGTFTATLYFHDKVNRIGGTYISKNARYKVTLTATHSSGSSQIYLQDIDNLRYNLSADLTMTQDLDFTDDNSYDQTDPYWLDKKSEWNAIGWTPIGRDPYSPYTGQFNGNGFSISNMKIVTVVTE